MLVLFAAASFFSIVYFQDWRDAKKYESKADSLGNLRCELERRDSAFADLMTPLTKENIAEFLRRRTGEVEIPEDENCIYFALKGDNYLIDCARLPQQFILRRGYGGMKDTDVDWDILEQAAVEISKSLIMVKAHVYANEGFEFMIVSTTHTIGDLREDFVFFMSLIADADQNLRVEYRKLMAAAHPEEHSEAGAGADAGDDGDAFISPNDPIDVALQTAMATSDPNRKPS